MIQINHRDKQKATAFLLAVYNQHTPTSVLSLLLNRGADANARSNLGKGIFNYLYWMRTSFTTEQFLERLKLFIDRVDLKRCPLRANMCEIKL